jgi:hypothetical protein
MSKVYQRHSAMYHFICPRDNDGPCNQAKTSSVVDPSFCTASGTQILIFQLLAYAIQMRQQFCT